MALPFKRTRPLAQAGKGKGPGATSRHARPRRAPAHPKRENGARPGTLPDDEVAAKVGRTPGAVRQKRGKLGTPNPATYVAVPVMLLAVTLVSCYMPAYRASKVDPMAALRYE